MAEPTKQTQNISPAGPGGITWNCSDVCASLDSVYKYVEKEAAASIEWYWKNKWWKAKMSSAIQFLAVILAALAGLVPILAQIQGGATVNAGLWSSVLVGTVASLLGLDKAFGFSSGWTRYVLTATSIRKALEEFRLDWAALSSGACPCPDPPAEQVAKMLQRARDFASTVEGLVLQETRDWATEFQANISQLEKDAKGQMDSLKAQIEKDRQAQAAASITGSIELTVANAASADGSAFQVRLEDANGKVKEASITSSAKWAEINLPAGQYKLFVIAKKNAKEVSDTTIVLIKSNETTMVSVTLAI